jgi:hypothetical protein
MEHSEIIEWAIGATAQFGSRGSQASVNWLVEVAAVFGLLPTKVEPTCAGSAQPSYSAHIPIWYSIFPLVQ